MAPFGPSTGQSSPSARKRTSEPEALDPMGSAAKPPKAPRVADLIGHTPLLRLDRLAAHVAPRVQVVAKAEFRNPGGSVKDRAALEMLRTAERSGLTKDRILLDATSGNTGIALAMLGASEGYRVTLCVPANLSTERRRILQAYGAELVVTPAPDGTDGAQRAAKALAASEPQRYRYLDQYNNEANWRAHFESSGAALDAALRLAERIREGVIVTVFPDAGVSYVGERYWEEGR